MADQEPVQTEDTSPVVEDEGRAVAGIDSAKDGPGDNGSNGGASGAGKASRKRTKTGCLTCRKRRIKCGEERPICANCIKSKRSCDGYNQPVVFKEGLGNMRAGVGAYGVSAGGSDRRFPYPIQPAPPSHHHLPPIAPAPPSSQLRQFAPIAPPPPAAGPPHLRSLFAAPQNYENNSLPSPSIESTISSGSKLHSPASTYPQHGNAATDGRSSASTISELSGSSHYPQSAQTASQLYHQSDSPTSFSHIHPLNPVAQIQVQRVNRDVSGSRHDHAGPTHTYARSSVSEGVQSVPMSSVQSRSSSTSEVHHNIAHRNDFDTTMDDLGEEEYEEDDEDDAEMVEIHEELAPRAAISRILEAHSRNVTGQGGTITYTTYLPDSQTLRAYFPSYSASPLMNPTTAKIFCHFVFVLGPSLSIFERTSPNPGVAFTPGAGLHGPQNVWTYTIPMLSLSHPPLLHAVLALSSLHLAKLTKGVENASLLHYNIALRRLGKAIANERQRRDVSTLAATLLLAFYETMTGEHEKWSRHLHGARLLIKEIDFQRVNTRVEALDELERSHQQTGPGNAHVSAEQAQQIQHQQQKRRMLAVRKIKRQATTPATAPNEVDDELTRIIMGEKPKRAPGGGKRGRPGYSRKELEASQLQADLFWWYCKMDVFSSILSGNPLLLDYVFWSQCPPRSRIGTLGTPTGSSDHLWLLYGRLVDFQSRDVIRKKKMEKLLGEWIPPQDMGGPPRSYLFQMIRNMRMGGGPPQGPPGGPPGGGSPPDGPPGGHPGGHPGGNPGIDGLSSGQPGMSGNPFSSGPPSQYPPETAGRNPGDYGPPQNHGHPGNHPIPMGADVGPGQPGSFSSPISPMGPNFQGVPSGMGPPPGWPPGMGPPDMATLQAMGMPPGMMPPGFNGPPPGMGGMSGMNNGNREMGGHRGMQGPPLGMGGPPGGMAGPPGGMAGPPGDMDGPSGGMGGPPGGMGGPPGGMGGPPGGMGGPPGGMGFPPGMGLPGGMPPGMIPPGMGPPPGFGPPGMGFGPPPGMGPGGPPENDAENPDGTPMYGMMPTYQGPQTLPTAFADVFGAPSPPSETGSCLSDESTDDIRALEAETVEAEIEWNEIRKAFLLFGESLGSDYSPLPPDAYPHLDTPFGPAISYRTYPMASLHCLYLTALIILERYHPGKPAMAMKSAIVSAKKTEKYAYDIARITAGLFPKNPTTQINPALGASLIESTIPLFFAGVQYQTADQRKWLTHKLREIHRTTGWVSASRVLLGCYQVWEVAAKKGFGEPFQRPPDDEEEDVPRPERQKAVVEGNEDPDKNFVLLPPTRLEMAAGILGEANTLNFDEEVQR